MEKYSEIDHNSKVVGGGLKDSLELASISQGKPKSFRTSYDSGSTNHLDTPLK